MIDHIFSSFAVPSIPQLHESLLGVHIQSTDIDYGSFHSNLVCGMGDQPGELANVHPSITFDEPISTVDVHATNSSTGEVVWDAKFALAGTKELTRDLPATGGTAPSWHKICTIPGKAENFRIDLVVNGVNSGPFKSQISFTSDNATAVQVPSDRAMEPRPSRVGPSPTPAVTVPIRPDDFDPRKYMKIPFLQ